MKHEGATWLTEDAARERRWAHIIKGKKIDPADRIERPAVRMITETLLDNIAAHLVMEGKLTEDLVTTSLGDPFTTFAFPLVRRVFPRLLANDLFSVQPMSRSTGKIFFLDTEYTGGGNRDDPAVFNKDYATTGEGAAVAEVNYRITDVTVTAERKALKAKWTIEAEQDLRSDHALSAEAELMAIVADELVREIDRTLIEDCLSQVPVGNQFTFSKTAPTGTPYSNLDPKVYRRQFWEKIVDANTAVFKKRHVNATWILAGADAAGYLEKLDEFSLSPTVNPTEWQAFTGSHFFGTLGNRWLVFKDPWFSADKMLLGYRGPSFMHAGYVYAPYIPVFTTALLQDPHDMTNRRGMMSRYARKMVIPEMYASLELTA